MKPMRLCLVAAVIIISLLPACKPRPSAYFFIIGQVSYAGSNGTADIMLRDTRDFLPIDDAVVTVQGRALQYDANTGFYSNQFLTGITAGKTVVIQISSSRGNFTVSGDMPAVTGSVDLSVPDAFMGSTITLTTP